MQNNKIISGLNYLSILFAPFVFPFIVWLVTDKNSDNHFHAGRAIKLHLVPVVFTLIVFIAIGGIGTISKNVTATGLTSMPLLIVAAIVDFVMGIYNIYYGIKIMVAAE